MSGRHARIGFVCTQVEFDDWKEKAKEQKLTLSAWIRAKLNDRLDRDAREEVTELIREIREECPHYIPSGAYCVECKKVKS